jgi:hypothetical protein
LRHLSLVVCDDTVYRGNAFHGKGNHAVVTGSHPEYHTPNTLNALQKYADSGGRLAYLGGNGFYWRIATSAEIPDVVEVRRAEGGIRAWAAEPGEYFQALDGGYGCAMAGRRKSFAGSGSRRRACSKAPITLHAWHHRPARRLRAPPLTLKRHSAGLYPITRISNIADPGTRNCRLWYRNSKRSRARKPAGLRPVARGDCRKPAPRRY